MLSSKIKGRKNEEKWYLFDADGKILGRLASRIATILMGKNTPEFTPHLSPGHFAVVLNAKKIKVTGKKIDDKIYRRHSGYPGALKERTLKEQLDRRPEKVIEDAVFGMLPKSKLGRVHFRHLKVYSGPEHPHGAQNPVLTELK